MNNDNTINNEDNPSTGKLRLEDIAWITEYLALKSIEVLRANPALYHQVADEMGVAMADIEEVGGYLEARAEAEAMAVGECNCPVCMGVLEDFEPAPQQTYH